MPSGTRANLRCLNRWTLISIQPNSVPPVFSICAIVTLEDVTSASYDFLVKCMALDGLVIFGIFTCISNFLFAAFSLYALVVGRVNKMHICFYFVGSFLKLKFSLPIFWFQALCSTSYLPLRYYNNWMCYYRQSRTFFCGNALSSPIFYYDFQCSLLDLWVTCVFWRRCIRYMFLILLYRFCKYFISLFFLFFLHAKAVSPIQQLRQDKDAIMTNKLPGIYVRCDSALNTI